MRVQSPHVFLEEKSVTIDLKSLACLQLDSPQHQGLASLTKFVATSFDVCGHVKLLKEIASADDILRSIKIKSVSENNDGHAKKIKLANLDANLRYCLPLDVNQVYTIRAELSDNLMQMLKLVPDERRVTVTDGPLLNVDFEQLEAKIEGQIRFVAGQTAPQDFLISLKSNDGKREWQQNLKLDCVAVGVSNGTAAHGQVCSFKVNIFLYIV